MVSENLKLRLCVLLIVAVFTIIGVCVAYKITSSTDSENSSNSYGNNTTTTTTSPGSTSMTTSSYSPASDYRPCNNSNGNVVCNLVLLEEVEKVFRRTSSPRLASIKLTLQPYIFSETHIPEDVFGTKRILDIRIEYPFGSVVNRSLSLDVDPNAFRSTKSYTNKFTINIIDCNVLDLGFLSGFNKLSELRFLNVNNIQHCLPSLPPLPRSTTLHIEYCTGMNELHVFPTLTNGLKDVNFFGDMNDIQTIYNDETVDRIMDWLILSSANTLEEMAIVYMNQVTQVPHQIAAFEALSKLWLNDNNISSIKSGAFSFSAPVSILGINMNNIKNIEPGAFQGDFKDAHVGVNNNTLTRFDESVFRPILEQMASGKGILYADAGNPIDCSEESICRLAWLRRYKAGSDFHLNCANGTKFQDLKPAGFNHCS